MHPGVIAASIAFLCGYAVGSLPVAWLLVRRRTGIDMRSRSGGGTGSLDAWRVAGAQTAALALVLELVKGAAVGLGASLYSDVGWFVASAIAGCVVGDAFPVAFGFRRGGRGLAPLVSGLTVALPAAGAIAVVTAVPAALFTSMRGRIYDAVVLIALPVGLLAGTRQWQSLVPAAVIVAALLGRAGLRRRSRAARLGAGHGTVLYAGGLGRPGMVGPGDAATPQNRARWDS